jgi:hypothetical protein
MARISTYVIDTQVTGDDKVIGTDASGSVTKNFPLKDIGTYFNENGTIAVAGQNVFDFQTNLNDGRLQATISFEGGGGNNTSFSSLTDLVISDNSKNENNIVAYFNTLVGENILIQNINKLDQFGKFVVNSYSDHATETDFHDINLTLINSNGSLVEGESYAIVISSPSKTSADIHYVWDQQAAQSVWDITHNLGKYPNVTVIDTGNNVIYGDIQYLTVNRLQISFASANAGKAYLN